MIRLVAVSRAIRDAVPPELVGPFWVITLLGSAKFLILVLALAYWNWAERRDDVLALVSVALVALGVTLVLKYGFDLPRPPEGVQRYPVETSDVGFPSGHAIAATVVYGGALVAFDSYRDLRNVLGVAALVLAIGLSRVVLGVHYLGDVAAGVAVGLVVLAGVALAVEHGARYGFAVAAALSVPAVAVTGGNADAALLLGVSLGSLAGTVATSGGISIRSGFERTVLNVGGVSFLGTMVAVEGLVTGVLVTDVLVAAAGVNFLLAFGIVTLPRVVSRIEAVGAPGRAAE